MARGPAVVEPPCPVYVVLADGTRRYCEVGPEGHDGTHFGDRYRADYERLRVAYEQGRVGLARRCASPHA